MLCQNLDMLDIVHAKDTNTAIFSFPWNREFAGQFDFLCKKEEITANMKKIFSGLPFHVINKLHICTIGFRSRLVNYLLGAHGTELIQNFSKVSRWWT